MHETHIPSCDHCKKFAFAFSKDSPLGDWGFCLEKYGGVLPGEALLRDLEAAAHDGDYGKVCSTKGLYQDTEDVCVQYEPL